MNRQGCSLNYNYINYIHLIQLLLINLIILTDKFMFQLNNSKSKQKYSFPKSSRFVSNENLTPLSYQIHQKNKVKGGVIGTTKRVDFNTLSISPAPKYQIKSQFDNNLQKKKGSNMGIGRDKILHTNYSYINLNSNPGPGQYDEKQNKNTRNVGITMGSKTRIPCHVLFLNDKAIDNIPGPGKYREKKFQLSGGRISSSSARFKTSRIEIPGPGHYDKQSNNLSSSMTKSFDRQNKSICVFPKEKRVNFIDEAIKKSNGPGPGKYRIYSEFEGKNSQIILNQ